MTATELNENELSGLLAGKRGNNGTTLTSLFEKPIVSDENLEKDVPIPWRQGVKKSHSEASARKNTQPMSCTKQDLQSTFVGSTVFLLYQVVFCLAQAATITRPHADHSSTGVMAQTAALGVMTAGPMFLYDLADQVPAIYPASDLFLAPFLAGLSQVIDQVLFEHGLENEDEIFLATFGMVIAVGFLCSGALCILAARVKLANLGAFLPYSVLCGFFTTIGILMWTLGFSVDVGKKVGEVIFSRDLALIQHALLHHIPSLCVGITMHILGPQNPLYVILLVFCTIGGSYVVMWLTGTSLVEAQELQWFFSPDDLIPEYPTLSLKDYALPAPFGVWVSAWRGDVFWEAFFAGMPMMSALVLLYLVRCSLHSAALKKNIPMVTRKVEDAESSDMSTRSEPRSKSQPPLTLNFILEHGYGYTQILNGIIGGIAIAPSVAASVTLFKLRAETPPPQYGSCLLVIIFYFSNFTLVQYIPKPAFSSLMVLAGLDMVRTWIYDSYFKTKAKVEWTVGPVLVVLSFTIGVLNAIFVGVAFSTFIFAANFYNAGAVKFVGNGLTLRSSVERGIKEDDWINLHGDWIQILVVQNYLFFGNCQSIVMYISTMFEDDENLPMTDTDSSGHPYSSLLPPKPKYLVVDFSLVSGMDTSAVDIMKEIISLCETNRCKLYLSGLMPSLKTNLLYAGLKPHSKRWAYTNDMETALAKAEDALLSTEFHLEELDEAESSLRRRHRSHSLHDDGFVYALQKIDEQHGLNTAEELSDLSGLTTPINLEPGDVLFRETDHGLYFVETGLLRVQWSTANTTRNLANLSLNPAARMEGGLGEKASLQAYPLQGGGSIGHLNARSATIGRDTALWKEHQQHTEQAFRLARIGQGWIIGGIEASNGMKRPGVHVAISSSRLHHLKSSAIKHIEGTNPKLAMNLYKMLSHLSTKRQEMTIGHLGQHLRILNSPVPRLRGRGRKGLAIIQSQPA